MFYFVFILFIIFLAQIVLKAHVYFYLFVQIYYLYWFSFFNKWTFAFDKIWWEFFSLGSLFNQSLTYQGNPCGIYLDLSSLSGSGVIQTLWPVSSDLLLVRITSSGIRASTLVIGSILSNFYFFLFVICFKFMFYSVICVLVCVLLRSCLCLVAFLFVFCCVLVCVLLHSCLHLVAFLFLFLFLFLSVPVSKIIFEFCLISVINSI